MPIDYRYSALASAVNWLTTELNSLANGARAVHATSIDPTTDKHLFADVELVVATGSGPAAGTYCDLYLIPTVDGTNFADSAFADLQPELLVARFSLRNATTNRRIVRGIALPPTIFKPLLVNASGVSFSASGSTVKAAYYSTRGV
jgi:hypothetical protein